MNEDDKKMNININSIRSIYLSSYYNEIELGKATGFIVKEKENLYLVTNRHVVTGKNNQTNKCMNPMGALPNKLKAWIPYLKEDKYCWKNVEIELYDNKENPVWKEHREYKEKIDVVAIYLGKNNIKTFTYNLKSSYCPIVAEQMYVIGFPYGFAVRPQEGKYAIWSSARAASDPDLDLYIQGEQLPAFLIDAKTRQGQSGSPVIFYNEQGMVRRNGGFSIYGSPITQEIGIYSGRINAESDLGYVWKWSLLSGIIEE